MPSLGGLVRRFSPSAMPDLVGHVVRSRTSPHIRQNKQALCLNKVLRLNKALCALRRIYVP
jgi:hypothetical protein